MDFTFSELDESLRDGVRAVLEARCSPATIRAAWDAEPGPTDRGAWDALAEVGVLDALVPEDQGGVGLDERSVVLVFQAAGYSGLPDPLIETAAFAAPLLGPHYAGSRTMVTTNVGSGPEGDLAPWAADADLLLLMAPDGAIHVRPPEAVTLIPTEAVDRSRRLWRVQWEPGPAELDAAATDVARAVDHATLAAAAELVGLGERMLDMTVGYVSQREQFGTRIGAFQAIKHRLADAAVALEFARPAAYRAAWSLATRDAAGPRDVSMAKAMASDAALLTARAALQCHGAIGYTTEHDLHLFMKRAWALARAWGDSAHHRQRVGAALGI